MEPYIYIFNFIDTFKWQYTVYKVKAMLAVAVTKP